MRLLLIVVGVLVALNVVFALVPMVGFNSRPSTSMRTFAEVKAHLDQISASVPLEPRFPAVKSSLSMKSDEEVEHFRMELRKRSREIAFDALMRPWSTFCTDEGQRRLTNALNFYYENRRGQQFLYKAERSDEGITEGKVRWSLADDLRIEELTRETYRRGNFNPKALKKVVAEGLVDILRDNHPGGPDCTDRTEPIVRGIAGVNNEEPLTATEQRRRKERDTLRQAVLAQSDQLSARSCENELRLPVLYALRSYFDLRNRDEITFPGTWSEAGERYVAEAWGTPDDQRIEALAREAASQGYVTANDLPPGAQKLVLRVFGDVTAPAPICRG
jgi:hypothetical protein